MFSQVALYKVHVFCHDLGGVWGAVAREHTHGIQLFDNYRTSVLLYRQAQRCVTLGIILHTGGIAETAQRPLAQAAAETGELDGSFLGSFAWHTLKQ